MSQMPDWSFFKDGDGNTYYIDTTGQIRTSLQAEPFRKTMSVRGLEFYNAQAKELIENHRPVEGLLILKTILAMPVIDQRVADAQTKAAAELHLFKSRQGTRFDVMNRQASPLLFSSGGLTFLVHDILYFSFSTPGELYVLRNRWRINLFYAHNGLSIGVRIDNQRREKGYDFLIAVDSEKFESKIASLRQLEENWTNRLFFEDIERREISRDENRVLYSFKAGKKGGNDFAFAGFETLVKNANFGYYMRTITPFDKSERFEAAMRDITTGFSISDLN